MVRKKTFMTLKEAQRCGPYDERPMLPDDVDPQLHLSQNDRPQPFFLICEKDTLIVQVSGNGRIHFHGTSVHFHPAAPGDFIYVPAGTPHRFVPDTPSIIHRYKPREPGLEGVAWYCDGCATELHRVIWDTADMVPQAAYLKYCQAFNDAEDLRRCPNCSEVYEAIDLEPYRWAEIAGELRPAETNVA